MTSELSDEERLLAQLCREPQETAWLEFKENLADTEQIGEYVSALSNGAVLESRAQAYLVWGVSDHEHNIVGTAVDPTRLKVGAEDFVPWLLRLLTPHVDLNFIKVCVSVDVTVWMLEIAAARTRRWGSRASSMFGWVRTRRS